MAFRASRSKRSRSLASLALARGRRLCQLGPFSDRRPWRRRSFFVAGKPVPQSWIGPRVSGAISAAVSPGQARPPFSVRGRPLCARAFRPGRLPLSASGAQGGILPVFCSPRARFYIRRRPAAFVAIRPLHPACPFAGAIVRYPNRRLRSATPPRRRGRVFPWDVSSPPSSQGSPGVEPAVVPRFHPPFILRASA